MNKKRKLLIKIYKKQNIENFKEVKKLKNLIKNFKKF